MGLAIALFVAIVLVPPALGGIVVGGKIDAGRYYVVAKGHRYTEVTAAQWRVEQHLEWAFPWLPVMLIWIGVELTTVPGAEPSPPPTNGNSAGNLFIAFGIFAGSIAMAVARCFHTGVPWTYGLSICLALWVVLFALIWWNSRLSRAQSE